MNGQVTSAAKVRCIEIKPLPGGARQGRPLEIAWFRSACGRTEVTCVAAPGTYRVGEWATCQVVRESP